jgi:hypothetical protein
VGYTLGSGSGCLIIGVHLSLFEPGGDFYASEESGVG